MNEQQTDSVTDTQRDEWNDQGQQIILELKPLFKKWHEEGIHPIPITSVLAHSLMHIAYCTSGPEFFIEFMHQELEAARERIVKAKENEESASECIEKQSIT